MLYEYPMLTEMEIGRQFVIDAMPYLEDHGPTLWLHGFDVVDGVRNSLFNEVADITDLETLDDLILDLVDVMTELGIEVSFVDKGYKIEAKSDETTISKI